MLKWINLKLARLFTKGDRCCNCQRYDYSNCVCSVYFLHQKQIFYLKTSPWDICLLADLRGDIKVADLDSLKAQSDTFKEELEAEEVEMEEENDQEN